MSFSGASATLVRVFVGPDDKGWEFWILILLARAGGLGIGDGIAGERFTCQGVVQVVIRENEAILLVFRCSHEVTLAFLTVEHGHNGRSCFPAENCSLRNHLRLFVGAKMANQTDVQRRLLRERNASVGFVMVLVGQPHDALAAENKTAVFSVFGIEHCFRENTLAALNAADRRSFFDCIVIDSV